MIIWKEPLPRSEPNPGEPGLPIARDCSTQPRLGQGAAQGYKSYVLQRRHKITKLAKQLHPFSSVGFWAHVFSGQHGMLHSLLRLCSSNCTDPGHKAVCTALQSSLSVPSWIADMHTADYRTIALGCGLKLLMPASTPAIVPLKVPVLFCARSADTTPDATATLNPS